MSFENYEEVVGNNHITLMCCDCMQILPKIPSESVDLLVTDPPYKVTPKGTSKSTVGGMLAKPLYKKGKVFQHNNLDCTVYAPEFFRILKDGSHCYVMTNHVNLQHFLNTYTKAGFHFIKSLIWLKDNKICGGFYMSQFEYILFFRKGRGIPIRHAGTSDVFEEESVNEVLRVPNKKLKAPDGSNLHDTEKPVSLVQTLITNSSDVGNIVIDPFMGIGSVGVACKATGRQFIGMEIDESYFKTAKERVKNTVFQKEAEEKKKAKEKK